MPGSVSGMRVSTCLTKQQYMINITFPDGGVKQFEAGVTPLQIAESISPRFAADVLAAKVNGQEWDISRPVEGDASIEQFKWDDPDNRLLHNSDRCRLDYSGRWNGQLQPLHQQHRHDRRLMGRKHRRWCRG